MTCLAPLRRPGAAVLAVALFATIALRGGAGLAQQPPAELPVATADTVVVQYDTPATARAQGNVPPPLSQLGYRRLAVPPGKTRAAFIAELQRDPRVLSVEPNAVVEAAAVPDDPYYEQNQAAYMNLVKAQGGWDVATGRGDVTVAVLDSGTDLSHPDLAGRLWENPRDSDNDGVDDDNNGCVDDRYGCRFVNVTTENAAGCGYTSSAPVGDVRDDHGKPGSAQHSHGTLVAGILAAAGNNGIGVTGAAWNVKVMTVKVLDCGPFDGPKGEMVNVAEGIDYARRMGAKVINLSLATPAGSQLGDIQKLRDAIAAAEAEGVIIVAAAGNHAPGATQVGPGYPAAYTQYSNLVSVGSSDANGNWSNYSNYGPALDIAAPGVRIAGTVRTDIGFAQPYGTAPDGTSFATPIVSGLLALMRTRNSALTATEYIEIMKTSASTAPAAPHGQNWAGGGIVNFAGALARVPMTLTGNALQDWNYVGAGTEVRATVDGATCGTTSTFMVGPVSRFALQVRAEPQQPGCGAPGRSVAVEIGGQAGQPTFPWGGLNADLALVSKDVTAVSPPPGQLVVQPLGSGWNNIAHLEQSGPLPGVLTALPGGFGTLLKWDPLKELTARPGGWLRYYPGVPEYVNDLTSLTRYDAYWVESGGGSPASLNPNPSSGRSVGLQPGWNNITWTGRAEEVGTALEQIDGKYSIVLQWDNLSQSWLQYIPGQPRYLQAFNGLFQFKTYWVLMTDPGVIVMP